MEGKAAVWAEPILQDSLELLPDMAASTSWRAFKEEFKIVFFDANEARTTAQKAAAVGTDD